MELRSPIRFYWDLTPFPANPPDYNRICSEIASSRALTLHITDLGLSLSSTALDVIQLLAASPIALSLTVADTAICKAFPQLAGAVKSLFIDVSAYKMLSGLSDVCFSGMSYRVTRENHVDLPGVVEWCLERGVSELVLPMERLITGEMPLCLSCVERETLAKRLEEIPYSGKLAVTVNDPFLWRVVHPGVPFPDGVCQAANTMLAIDPSGDVYPCPAMPVKLGNLQQSTFREIVASPLKKEVRNRILAPPSGCIECRIFDACRGGCRGRGFHSTGILDAADPGCGIPPLPYLL